MNRAHILVLSSLLLSTSLSCQSTNAPLPVADKPSENPVATQAATSAPAPVEIPTTGIHTITLPAIETELPPGPGKLTLVSACTLCHTPRYVTMQPNFSRKKWTDEVEKMKKVYGAPLLDEQVEPIVNYLVAIRGDGK